MDNVPVRTDGHAPLGRHSADRPNHHSNNDRPKKNKRRLLTIAAGAVLLLVILLGIWFLVRSSTGMNIDGSKYQAVFFTNGQVYFGKLHTLNGSYMKLTNVFYIQSQPAAPQTADGDSENPQETSTEQTPDVQLIKLGNEIHGPEDEMIISRDQILFFENLKKDGKVSNSINTYRKEKP